MAWTTIDADTSWQELAIAQEIATAYNKRVATFTSAEQISIGIEEITPDEDMTVSAFVLEIQTGIEAMATRFGDPDAELTGQSALPSNWSSVAAMMTAAGLTKSGYWRRIAEGGTQPTAWTTYTASGWSYGKITDKDLAGPWLFKDLQTALSAMKRRIGDYIAPVAETYDEGEWGGHLQVSADVVPTGNVDKTITDVDWFSSNVAILSEKCKGADPHQEWHDNSYVDNVWCIFSLHLVKVSCGLGVPGVTATRKLVAKMESGSSSNPFAAVTGFTSSNYLLTYLGEVNYWGDSKPYLEGWLWKKPSSTGTTAWSTISGCQTDPPDGYLATDMLVYGDCCSVIDYDFDP